MVSYWVSILKATLKALGTGTLTLFYNGDVDLKVDI